MDCEHASKAFIVGYKRKLTSNWSRDNPPTRDATEGKHHPLTILSYKIVYQVRSIVTTYANVFVMKNIIRTTLLILYNHANLFLQGLAFSFILLVHMTVG